jgi:hypothetical protein
MSEHCASHIALTAINSPLPIGTRLVVKLESLLTRAINGRHLLRMRSGVIDHQETARPKDSYYIRPPTSIFSALRIKEFEVKGRIRRAFEHATGVSVHNVMKEASPERAKLLIASSIL